MNKNYTQTFVAVYYHVHGAQHLTILREDNSRPQFHTLLKDPLLVHFPSLMKPSHWFICVLTFKIFLQQLTHIRVIEL